MNNKIISPKKTNAIFFAVILLVAGVIVMSSPFAAIAYDSVNHRMYVTNISDNTVSVINLC